MQQTQASPLAQRIQFLEAKGLTALEIEDAMRQSAANHTQQQPHPASYLPVYGPSPYAAIPPQLAPQWDWRDYFV
jgi:peroxin-14